MRSAVLAVWNNGGRCLPLSGAKPRGQEDSRHLAPQNLFVCSRSGALGSRATPERPGRPQALDRCQGRENAAPNAVTVIPSTAKGGWA
jgi:hypothetical protein